MAPPPFPVPERASSRRPPPVSARRPSRFREGSMRDRASAIPPISFLGPLATADFAAALDDDAHLPALLKETDFRARGRQRVRRDDGQLAAPNPSQPPIPPPLERPSNRTLLRPRPRLRFGQVWGGVRDRLGLGRDRADDASLSTTTPSGICQDDHHQLLQEAQLPSREEVLANYQQLVASGFFSSRAIHASRQPGPPPARAQADVGSPIVSPSSVASSRGTKRAAADEAPEYGLDYAHAGAAEVGGDDGKVGEAVSRLGHASTAAAPPLPPPTSNRPRASVRKRLRKSCSSDGPLLFIPKLRSVASRRSLVARLRGSSTSDTASSSSNSSSTAMVPPIPRRRPPPPPPPPTLASRPRTPRPRIFAAGPLTAMPDANRGIPDLPPLPPKYAAAVAATGQGQHEDRQPGDLFRQGEGNEGQVTSEMTTP